MAKRRARPQSGGGRVKSGGTAGVGRMLLGFVLGGAVVASAGYLYLHSSPGKAGGVEPAPIAERPRVTAAPAGKTAGGEMARAKPEVSHALPDVSARRPPFGASEDVFEAGAAVYAARCASCHGTPRHDAGGKGGQRAAQLFRAGRQHVSGESDGQLFAAINLGAQGLGMPAYHGILTEPQIWQLVLLLKSAAEPLPDPVAAELDGPGSGR